MRQAPPRRAAGKRWAHLSLILAVAGLCTLLASLKFAREDLAWPGWGAVLPVTGALALIAAGPLNPVSRLLLANRFSVFVGLISYPLYLWHWVLLSFAHITSNGLPPDAVPLRLAMAATAFALAVLTYLLVERPLRFGQRGRKAKIVALVLSMILLGGTGLAVQQMHGLPDRGDFRRLAAMSEQLKLPEIRDAEGLAYAGTGKEQLAYYRFTNAGSGETVAVIGDSHALTAYSGIAALGKTLGWNTALLGAWIPGMEIWEPAGISQQETILAILCGKRDVKRVFICTRGMMYIAGEHNYTGDMRAKDIARDRARAVGGERFGKALQDLVDALRAAGKEVFIVAENPGLPDTVRNYVERPFNLSTSGGKFPEVRKEDVIRAQRPYLDILAGIAGATVIDTIGPMCPDGACMVFAEDGMPLYFDDDHLSYAGSAFQAEHILRPYLEGGVRVSPSRRKAGGRP